MEAGTGRDGGAGGSGGVERAGLGGPGHRGYHHGGQTGAGGHRRRGPGQCRLLHSRALRHRPAARAGHTGIAGLWAQGPRRMSPLAGPGRLAGVHRDAATDAAHLCGQFWLCALRHHATSGHSRRLVPARPQLGHAAAAALRRNAPLSARCRRCASDYRHLCRGQPAQLVRKLGAHLRQVGNAGPGRERFSPFHGRLAHLHGSSADGLCLAL